MTCLYSSNPWNLKITKLGANLYIDKIENSEIDLMRVNESDNTPNDEDDRNINIYKSLAIEATLINEFLKEQMLDFNSKKFESEGPYPFIDETIKKEDIERLGYRYRLWTIDDMKILVRCQVHSFSQIDEDSENRKSSESEEVGAEEEEEKETNLNIEFINIIYTINEYIKMFI